MTQGDERDLILGLLLPRVAGVTPEQMVPILEAWSGQKELSLLEVCVERGVITAALRAEIETRADEIIRRAGGNASRALEHLLSSDTPTEPASELPVIVGRYTGIRVIPIGNLGWVCVARDDRLKRIVVVKLINPGRDNATTRAQFEREMLVTAALEHPNIVPVFDSGKDAEKPFYVMRYIPGDSLKQAIARHHPAPAGQPPGERTLALRDLLGRFVSVCEAVAYAHSKEIVHRDIKPANIMVGAFGEAQLIDWGLAKVADQLGAPAHAGTPAYMAPEQAEGLGDRIGPATDIYALGGTLYQILTGRSAFQGAPTEFLPDVIRGIFPRPRQVNPEVASALEAICLKAMAREPADRYPSAKALAGDIDRWLADEPVEVYRDPWTVRVARFAKRHRTAMTAVGVLVATSLVGLGVGNVLVRQQRDIARDSFKAASVVIDTLGKEIGDDAWAVIPNAELNRLNMMHESNRQYEVLLRRQPRDQKIRLDAADGYLREGNLARLVAQYGEADRLYSRAAELVTSVLDATPGNPDAILMRFWVLADRCVLRHFRADPAAGDGYREALAAAAAIQRQFPEVTIIGVVSRIKADYGGWQVDDGRPAEGLALLREAVDGLVLTGPSMQDGIDHPQMTLVATLCALSRAEAETGNLPAAIATADRALAAADAGFASAKVPNHPDLVQMKGAALLQRALLAARSPGQIDDTIAQATAAVDIYRALAARNKKIPGHHRHHAEAVISRGEMLYAAGRRDEALKDVTAALAAVAAAEQVGTETARQLALRPGGVAGQPDDVLRIVDQDAARAWLLKARLRNDANDLANAKPILQQARERIDKALRSFPRCPEALRVEKAIDDLEGVIERRR